MRAHPPAGDRPLARENPVPTSWPAMKREAENVLHDDCCRRRAVLRPMDAVRPRGGAEVTAWGAAAPRQSRAPLACARQAGTLLAAGKCSRAFLYRLVQLGRFGRSFCFLLLPGSLVRLGSRALLATTKSAARVPSTSWIRPEVPFWDRWPAADEEWLFQQALRLRPTGPRCADQWCGNCKGKRWKTPSCGRFGIVPSTRPSRHSPRGSGRDNQGRGCYHRRWRYPWATGSHSGGRPPQFSPQGQERSSEPPGKQTRSAPFR
jgi:hypothetical protein